MSCNMFGQKPSKLIIHFSGGSLRKLIQHRKHSFSNNIGMRNFQKLNKQVQALNKTSKEKQNIQKIIYSCIPLNTYKQTLGNRTQSRPTEKGGVKIKDVNSKVQNDFNNL